MLSFRSGFFYVFIQTYPFLVTGLNLRIYPVEILHFLGAETYKNMSSNPIQPTYSEGNRPLMTETGQQSLRQTRRYLPVGTPRDNRERRARQRAEREVMNEKGDVVSDYQKGNQAEVSMDKLGDYAASKSGRGAYENGNKLETSNELIQSTATAQSGRGVTLSDPVLSAIGKVLGIVDPTAVRRLAEKHSKAAAGGASVEEKVSGVVKSIVDTTPVEVFEKLRGKNGGMYTPPGYDGMGIYPSVGARGIYPSVSASGIYPSVSASGIYPSIETDPNVIYQNYVRSKYYDPNDPEGGFLAALAALVPIVAPLAVNFVKSLIGNARKRHEDNKKGKGGRSILRFPQHLITVERVMHDFPELRAIDDDIRGAGSVKDFFKKVLNGVKEAGIVVGKTLLDVAPQIIETAANVFVKTQTKPKAGKGIRFSPLILPKDVMRKLKTDAKYGSGKKLLKMKDVLGPIIDSFLLTIQGLGETERNTIRDEMLAQPELRVPVFNVPPGESDLHSAIGKLLRRLFSAYVKDKDTNALKDFPEGSRKLAVDGLRQLKKEIYPAMTGEVDLVAVDPSIADILPAVVKALEDVPVRVRDKNTIIVPEGGKCGIMSRRKNMSGGIGTSSTPDSYDDSYEDIEGSGAETAENVMVPKQGYINESPPKRSIPARRRTTSEEMENRKAELKKRLEKELGVDLTATSNDGGSNPLAGLSKGQLRTAMRKVMAEVASSP